MCQNAKLNLKFYILVVVLSALVAFGWYGVFFLNTHEILMEDNTPMTAQSKLWFTIALSVILSSWTLSWFVAVCQTIRGYAFELREDCITSTLSVLVPLAFIFVLPIKQIPFDAITGVTIENGITTLHLDRTKLPVCRLWRWLITPQYQLCAGYIRDQNECVARFRELYDHYR